VKKAWFYEFLTVIVAIIHLCISTVILHFLHESQLKVICGVMQAYDMRNAGAVIHSHGMESCLVTMINPLSKEFRVSLSFTIYMWL
jgi:hypothetical protein